MQKLERKKNSRKIVTSLAYIFTMEKAQVKIIFGHKIYICQQIFKIFVVLFMTFGMKKDDKISLLKMFQNKVICNWQFPKDGVRRVAEVLKIWIIEKKKTHYNVY